METLLIRAAVITALLGCGPPSTGPTATPAATPHVTTTPPPSQPDEPPAPAAAPIAVAARRDGAPPAAFSERRDERRAMVARQLRSRDISDEAVLAAMAKVPRHAFVPPARAAAAYADSPLPIGHRQTISQPYIVALMTQLARPRAAAGWRGADGRPLRVLDVGTGSGYQAAVLAELVGPLDSVEIVCPLADEARARLQSLGYDGVRVRCGDGYAGLPARAPFDVIVLAAAPPEVPQPLVDQLAPGGRLVLPVGRREQRLMVVERDLDGVVRRLPHIPVRFVPMTGRAQQPTPAPGP